MTLSPHSCQGKRGSQSYESNDTFSWTACAPDLTKGLALLRLQRPVPYDPEPKGPDPDVICAQLSHRSRQRPTGRLVGASATKTPSRRLACLR